MEYNITLAHKKDIEELAQVYSICFGDEDEYIRFFYENTFDITDTFIVRDNDKIASMLTAFAVNMRLGEKVYKGVYLYLVSTLPEYRGKGLMRKVENFVEKYYKNLAFDFISLVPKSEDLIKMYEKLSYKALLKLGYRTIIKEEICSSEKSEFVKLEKNEFFAMRNLYLNSLNANIEFDSKIYNYLYDELVFDDFDIIKITNKYGNGYVICKKYESKLYIKEMTLNKNIFNSVADELFSRYNVSEIEIRANENLLKDMQVKPYAMIKMLNEDLMLSDSIYINLMLD